MVSGENKRAIQSYIAYSKKINSLFKEYISGSDEEKKFIQSLIDTNNVLIDVCETVSDMIKSKCRYAEVKVTKRTEKLLNKFKDESKKEEVWELFGESYGEDT